MANTTLRLTSADFTDGSAIPRRFTCDGENVSPSLIWEGAPSSTASFALIMEDPDANGFIHWVAYNIGGSATGSLPAGVSASPDGPAQGQNSFGRTGYGGPCPPSGEHRYAFRLLALDAMLQVARTPTAQDVEAQATGHVLAEARLTGRYRRA